MARCERIAGADSVESQQAEEILSKYLEYWDSKRPGNYKNDSNEADALLQSAEELARKSAVGTAIGYIYPVPNSMRSVEPNSKIRITDRASRFSPNGKSTSRGEPNGQ